MNWDFFPYSLRWDSMKRSIDTESKGKKMQHESFNAILLINIFLLIIIRFIYPGENTQEKKEWKIADHFETFS